jgi:hypothetical protein
MPHNVTEPEFDALAAEYVLGTLDASERAHTRMLLDIDGGFAAKVRMWERRLGELHLMVEPIEPDWQVFERVKARIGGFQANPFYQALGARQDNESAPAAPEGGPQPGPPGLWDTAPGEVAAPEPAVPEAGLPPATPAVPLAAPGAGEGVSASSAMPGEATADPSPSLGFAAGTAGPPAPETPVLDAPLLASPGPIPREPVVDQPRAVQPISRPESERTIPVSTISRGRTVVAPAAPGDVIRWRRSIRQWRTFALLMMVLALMLASFVAALRNFPERLPPSVRAQFITTAAAPLSEVLRVRPSAPPGSQFEE